MIVLTTSYDWSDDLRVFLSFTLLFWNHVLICFSVKFSEYAISILRLLEIYWQLLNSSSNSCVCCDVNDGLLRMVGSKWQKDWSQEQNRHEFQCTLDCSLWMMLSKAEWELKAIKHFRNDLTGNKRPNTEWIFKQKLIWRN